MNAPTKNTTKEIVILTLSAAEGDCDFAIAKSKDPDTDHINSTAQTI
jgi:hypothetical protein